MTADGSSSDIRRTVRSDGLTVLSRPMPHLGTASIGVWLDVGARHEPAERNGVAHFLEHMAFKGTNRRNAQAIASEIEDVGGQLNAYTSREQTAYYARILADDLPLAVDLLSDILQHSTIDEEELERERTVILQEISQLEDTPDEWVFDQFQACAFPDHPLGRSILGAETIIKSMPRAALTDYMGSHYGPETMVVAASGKLDHDRLVDLVDDHFDDLRPVGPNGYEPCRYQGGADVRDRDLEQVHLIVGLEGVQLDDPDYYALQVLTTALGGGMSSRLFQEIREKRGLAYSVFSFSASYRDGGLFGMYAGTGEREVDDVVAVMADQLLDVVANADDAELARARAQLKAGLLMSLESCSAVCEDLARHELMFGRQIPMDEMLLKIDQVDGAAIRKVGRRLIEGARPTMAAIGPARQVPDLEIIREALRL
ncbi:MAG: M16 family metallopeptidase [Geminicoccaceae bacterium]